jgi:hypothetical protein
MWEPGIATQTEGGPPAWIERVLNDLKSRGWVHRQWG